MANNSNLPNLKDLIAAGIDPYTRLPIKLTEDSKKLKENIRKALRIKDEQEAVNRYKYENLPFNLSSQEVERLLYYRAQLVMFELKPGEFYLMPFALNGSIDFYGRFNTVTPVPIASGTDKKIAAQRAILSNIKIDVIYDLKQIEKDEAFNPNNKGVILWDYTRQLSETVLARCDLQEPILDVMSDCIPFTRTALLNSTGIEGVRVKHEDEYTNVEAASRSINRAALEGRKYVALLGQLDFQELTGGNVAKAEEFMQAMQSFDNFRKSLYGLDNGGLFEKKAHMLQDEQEMNGGGSNSVLEDGLLIRQNFCDIANKIWGLNMSVRISNSAQSATEEEDPMNDEEEDNEGGIGDE